MVPRKLQGNVWRGRGRLSSALDPHRGACVWPANKSLSPWWPDFGCQATRCNTAVWSTFATPSPAAPQLRSPRGIVHRPRAPTRSHTYWPTVKGPRHPLLSKRLSERLTFDVDNKPVRFYKMNYLILSSTRFDEIYYTVFMANKRSLHLFLISVLLTYRQNLYYTLFLLYILYCILISFLSVKSKV